MCRPWISGRLYSILNSVNAFLRLWMSGYRSPGRLVEGLREAPAPRWGLYATLLRGALDSLLLFLPLALLDREPTTPSALTFLSEEHYYAVSAAAMPLFLLAQWLIGGAFFHLVLRLAGRRSDVDVILNLTGMAALVVGAWLVVWDWIYMAAGGADPVTLGITHLLFDGWGVAILTVGLNRLLGVPVPWALLLTLLGILVGLPPAMLLVRAPV
jgi:hypothetical protein